MDGVGLVRLAETAEEVRFGRSACDFEPIEGLEVLVSELQPHPLGGRRAKRVRLRQPSDADDALDLSAPLAGLHPSDADVAEFLELVRDIGLFALVVAEPLRTRRALRAFLSAGADRVDFLNPRAPLVGAGGYTYRVWPCMAPMAGGAGAVLFCRHEPFSLQTEREHALFAEADGPGPWRGWLEIAPLADLVGRCACGATGVLMAQAEQLLVRPAEWARLRGPDPAVFQPEAFVSIGAPADHPMAFTAGLRALLLPEIVCHGADGTQADTQALLWDAAAELVAGGCLPHVGSQLAGAPVYRVGTDYLELALTT